MIFKKEILGVLIAVILFCILLTQSSCSANEEMTDTPVSSTTPIVLDQYEVNFGKVLATNKSS